jgi:uncharacterized protein with PIN domain
MKVIDPTALIAVLTREPLLYKGADFTSTDIRSALEGYGSTKPNAAG